MFDTPTQVRDADLCETWLFSKGFTNEQINHINLHDSFGINYSFLKADIIPTYHHFGWHRNRYDRWKLLFSPYREKYKNVYKLFKQFNKE